MESSGLFSPSSRRPDPKHIGLWKVGRTLGSGNSGRVRIAKHSRTGQHAAVKIISKVVIQSQTPTNKLPEEIERNRIAAEREIVVMKLLEHPNIMQIYDVWETSTELYLILEYVKGGELFDLLCKKGKLPLPEALHFFQQIIGAVDYLHRFKIAHRDLKPENILVDEHNNIKIADFGMAIWQAEGADNLLKTCCGSPHYAAPEIIKNQRYDGPAADTWSCGIILYALLTGGLPFDHEDYDILLDLIRVGNYEIPASMHPDAQQLIKQMLNTNPAHRITTAEILEHPFFHLYEPRMQKQALTGSQNDVRIIENANAIDPCILSNLKALWDGTPEHEIQENLLSNDSNWQKTIYWLLIDYRDKHLEEISADTQEEKRLARERTQRRKAKAGHKKAFSASNVDNVLAMVGLPQRNAPPTPRKAAGRQRSASSEASLSEPAHSPPSQAPQRMPRITPPKAKNKDVQQFYNQIAEQINALDARTSATSDDPCSSEGSTPTKSPGVLQPTNKEVAKKPKGTRPLSINRKQNRIALFSDKPKNVDKENIGIGPPPQASDGGKTQPNKRASVIDTDFSKAKLSKKQTSRRASDVGVSTSSMATAPVKRRWLENVFNFRPAPLTLLSTCDLQVTRSECRKLLTDMCVDVAPENDVTGVLKCKMGEFKDPAGVMASLKPARFKVVFQQPRIITYGDDQRYVMALTLVHEKGAPETFREVCKKLEQVWLFDPLNGSVE